jgi:hypothetical protein
MEPREGTPEWHFDKGARAYSAGEPITACPTVGGSYDWRLGWSAQEARKVRDFNQYRKMRALHDMAYMSPMMPKDALETMQAARKKIIESLEAEWPDFAAAFTRLKESSNG